MIYLILAISSILNLVSCTISIFAYYKVSQIKTSVPDRPLSEEPSPPAVAKDSAESDPEEKWKNLKQAFNLSGNTNGRSRTS